MEKYNFSGKITLKIENMVIIVINSFEIFQQ